MKNFDFASPSQYGDWAQYAGFNRTTGEVEGMQSPQQGIAPPGNLTEYVNQKLGSASSMAGAIAPAMAQLGTGNVMGAANTMKQARNPMQPSPVATQPAPIVGYDYTHGLDLDKD
jgi:hypothetical protein